MVTPSTILLPQRLKLNYLTMRTLSRTGGRTKFNLRQENRRMEMPN